MARLLLEEIAVPLRSFSVRLSLDVGSTIALVGPSGRRQDDGAARRRRASSGRAPAGSASTVTSGSTARAASIARAGPAAGRARVPGLRPLPAPDGPPEHRVRAPPQGRRVPRAVRDPPPRSAPSGRPLRRRAAACRARPGARARSARAAARRAALGARRPHEGRRPRRAAASCWSASRMPVLLVTHDFEDAAALADQVGVIVDGELRQTGTPAELVASPRDPFVASFTGANLLHGRAEARERGIDARPAGRRHRHHDRRIPARGDVGSPSIRGTSRSRPRRRTTPR